MGIFDKIKNAIFGHAQAAEGQAAATGTTTAPAQATPAAPAPAAASATTPSVTPSATPAPAPSPASPVDVTPVLDAAVARSGQKLDWRKSIVDLMKALDLDSSLAARKELAEELGYTGARDGSAEMNTWLHKALMKKLSENGGKVPADLLD